MERGADVTVTVRQYTSGIVDIPRGCKRIGYKERYGLLPECELVVSATSSPNFTLRREEMAPLKVEHPICLVDLAVPRDIEPEVASLPHFTLYDIDAFQIDLRSDRFRRNLARAEEILAEEQKEFTNWYEGRDMVPRIQALKACAGQDVDARLTQVFRSLALDPPDKDALAAQVDGAAQRMMNRLLFGLRARLPEQDFSRCVEAMEAVFRERALPSADSGNDVAVVFNRNASNMGILANWLKLASLTHGEMLVMAGGDDISLPERTEKIASAWVADGKRAAVVSHAGYRIDPDGRPLGPLPAPCANCPLGAAMAWRRDCYTAFPTEPIRPRCVEDLPFAKRALMLGGELVLPNRLVQYRIGTGKSSPLRHHRGPAIFSWRVKPPSMDQALHDLEAIADSMPPERVEKFRQAFAAERARAENHLKLLESPSFRERWKAFKQERRTGFEAAAPFTYSYLLPRRIGDWVLDCITRLNLLRRRLHASSPTR